MLILVTAAVLSTSCNTFIGLGRDMRLAGEGMESTANKATGGKSSGDDGWCAVPGLGKPASGGEGL